MGRGLEYLRCYPTLWGRLLLEKLKVTQLVKKLAAFYGNKRIYYRMHHSPLMDAIMNPIHTHSHTTYPQFHLNISLPFTTRPPKQSPLFVCPDHKSVCISDSARRVAVLAQLLLICSRECCYVRSVPKVSAGIARPLSANRVHRANNLKSTQCSIYSTMSALTFRDS
jgi:hypothetical protein